MQKTARKKTYYRRKNISQKSIKNGHFWQNSKGGGGTKGKFSKMADFLVELPKAKKIGNTSRLMA